MGRALVPVRLAAGCRKPSPLFSPPDADEPQPKGEAWPLADDARGSGNRLLTRAALILVPEFPATFGTNFMMQVLTVEARDKTATTSLRLLAVLNVLSRTRLCSREGSSSGARLLLTAFSRTSPRHVVRKAG